MCPICFALSRDSREAIDLKLEVITMPLLTDRNAGSIHRRMLVFHP